MYACVSPRCAYVRALLCMCVRVSGARACVYPVRVCVRACVRGCVSLKTVHFFLLSNECLRLFCLDWLQSPVTIYSFL